MTSLDAYAAFLTARWDELEKAAQDWMPSSTMCDNCRAPLDDLDDLAAKRAVLDDAVESARWATNPDCPPESASFYRDRAGHLGDALHHLATPFRDHPDHPANQEA